jgi:hypothetical protein
VTVIQRVLVVRDQARALAAEAEGEPQPDA